MNDIRQKSIQNALTLGYKIPESLPFLENITLPEYLLNTVDNYAKKHGETRSGLLASAVTEYMGSHQ